MPPIFEAHDISMQLPDGRWLFQDVHFSLDRGSVLVLRGPSGVGKTTLLKCLAELIPHQRGTCKLLGKSPSEYGIPVWRSRVMYVPQRAALHPGTPLDLYEMVTKYASQRAKKSSFGDLIKIARSWNISEDLFSEPWSNLSGGEIQRCALAIALALEPDVLLLDEPTSALDPETVLLVEKTLKERTCVWITHSTEQEKRVATDTITLSRTMTLTPYDSGGEDGESISQNSATTITLDDNFL